MTTQTVSKEILKIHRTLGVLMANIILFGAMAVLFFLVSASSVIITGVITGVLVYGYMEVKKGKSRGFKWAAMINGMMGAATLWYMWLVRSGATPKLIMIAVVVVAIAAAFATAFYLGIKAFDGLSNKIDLSKTLEVFVEERKHQKEEGTFDAKAFRQSVKDGSFEMELVYKENNDLASI